MSDWIVCGWYTPDYEHWFRRLEGTLIKHGAPYDFRAVPKIDGGWERNTCRKAGFALDALDHHPGKTVIFLDVDCVVNGDLETLAAMPCDVALNFAVLRKKRRINLVPLTGHMIINPTPKARALIEAWAAVSEFGLQDQETLALAMGKEDGVDGVHIARIIAGGIVDHDSASAASGVQKINGRQRFKYKIMSALNSIVGWIVGPDEGEEEEYYKKIREQLRIDLTEKRLRKGKIVSDAPSWPSKLIQNLRPNHLEFQSEQEFKSFASRRPDLALSKKSGENEGHIYCTAKWKLF